MATPLRAHEDSHFVLSTIGLSIRRATPRRLARRPAPELSTTYPQLCKRESKEKPARVNRARQSRLAAMAIRAGLEAATHGVAIRLDLNYFNGLCDGVPSALL